MFNALQLQKGDFALVKRQGEQFAAEVTFAKRGHIAVQFCTGDTANFHSRSGYGDILAGARLVNGQWQAL
jgi:hypothetical protein